MTAYLKNWYPNFLYNLWTILSRNSQISRYQLSIY